MTAGALDRRLQFRRAVLADDGFTTSETWADHGSAVWGSRADVRDSEKWAAGQVEATTMSRFRVRWSSFTAEIDAKDRFTCDGMEWSILGLKEVGRREYREITALTGAD